MIDDLNDIVVGTSLDENLNGVPDECFLADGIPTVSEWGMVA